MGTLHDVAAGLAGCARACRDARSAVTALAGQRAAPDRADNRIHSQEFPRFQRHDRPRPVIDGGASERGRTEAVRR
jgi:hypothetical protein